MTVARLLQLLTPVLLWAALGVSLRLWLRQRSTQTRWLVATFGALDGVLLLGTVMPEEPSDLAIRGLVVVLLAFPWLLFRFADALVPAHASVRRGADLLFAVVVVVTLTVPNLLAEEGAALTAVQAAYVGLAIGEWALLTFLAGFLLFRGRRGQPVVVRRRLVMLSIGAWSMGLSLVASTALGGGSDPSDASILVTQGLAVASGLTFLIGFAPPRTLLASWRHDAEQQLYAAAVGFLAATDSRAITDEMLPRLQSLLGTAGAEIVRADGTSVAAVGVPVDPTSEDVVDLSLGSRRLRVVVASTTPLFGEGEDEIVARLGVLADLALDRLRLLDAERAARRELEALNDELESFVYTTSHDLKNPIIAMLGYLDLVEEDHADELPPDVRHYLSRMHANAYYMQALIRDLLELSRVGRVDVEPELVDLGALVDELGADLRQGHPELQLSRGELPQVLLNPTRARQLFANVLANAAQYGGRPDVAVSVTATTTLDGVLVVVEDDGVGIPEEHLHRVFGVFERLDPDHGGGTGMGLAICRRIVETAGGSIHAVPSTRGARIEIDLPGAPMPAPAAATLEQVTP